MSATKKEDAMFLNETRLLVKNDKMPKKNKALDNINISYELTDDNISLANKKEYPVVKYLKKSKFLTIISNKIFLKTLKNISKKVLTILFLQIFFKVFFQKKCFLQKKIFIKALRRCFHI